MYIPTEHVCLSGLDFKNPHCCSIWTSAVLDLDSQDLSLRQDMALPLLCSFSSIQIQWTPLLWILLLPLSRNSKILTANANDLFRKSGKRYLDVWDL
jgi:hypothetical protein